MRCFFTMVFGIFIFSVLPLRAQEISGNFGGGSIKVGPDNAPCDSARAGAIRYNSASAIMQMCNGTAWVSFASSNPNFGAPVYGREFVYEYDQYNTTLNNAVTQHTQHISEPDRTVVRQNYYDQCHIISATQITESNMGQSCGKVICQYNTGKEPYVAMIGNYCNEGGIAACNNGHFYLSWVCVSG